MKTVILAGGTGTRLSEETVSKPKPMVEIGGRPILWHILKMYSQFGLDDFIICLGYKGYVIKEYFNNYWMHNADITFDFKSDRTEIISKRSEKWRVSLVETGHDSMTGGRLWRVREMLRSERDFCFTYGDGVSDLNISELIKFHRAHGLPATVTAVRPPGRFGAVHLDLNSKVISFQEKPAGDGAWINGGFFVLTPEVFSYLKSERDIWEKEPLEGLARDGKLAAYLHHGYWHAMDTLRDRHALEAAWVSGKAPWKTWD